jgi:hypothetical protein
MLHYPNGRTFKFQHESDHLLRLGHEFDAFGHTWRIERELPPVRLTADSFSRREAFACAPVSDEASGSGTLKL